MAVRHKQVNVNPLKQLKAVLKSVGRSSNNNPIITTMYKNWTTIVRTFLHNRFIGASRGDGTWPALAKRTVDRKKSSLILIETNTLINAVDPGRYNAPGSYARRQGDGIVIGYGGSVVHPTAAKKGRSFTIQQIAEFHHDGGGKLPRRRIMVGIDRETVQKVTSEVNKAMLLLIREALQGQ